ncbi:tyrosine-protein phosphatase non-receptor type 5-like [Apostichopus japonicus]|uniref:tyrosine-protein phosphatase non-receptor type 5-like n=1 Tax=Stichopus japonicus TaxID=307972 RepID=UPI003AB2A43E
MRAPTVSLPLRGHVTQESASLPGTAPVVVPGSRITETSTVANDIHRVLAGNNLWQTSHAPYLVGVFCAIFIIFIAIVCYCCYRAWRSKHIRDEEKRRIALFPSIKPETREGSQIQPEGSYIQYASIGRTQPIGIQTREPGLQERRFSSTSLTLDISGPSDTVRWVASPPKESSVEEYLESAGNRLTRRQLKNALKNTRALHEEFWAIPMNHPETIEVPGSTAKNRYRTILPNPVTRVALPLIPGDPLSDYINANRIRGYDPEKYDFIACQGPMTHTIADFWRLVWHSNSPIIVMVTKLKERNRSKCEMYWPQRQGFYGEIEVTVEDIIKQDDYVLRIFAVKYLEECRQVLHYWYTSWPDNKPPENPNTLLNMIKDIEISRKDTSITDGPVIVHCSAGLGRTGCYIAISIGMRQLDEEHMTDILGIVCQLRQDRGGLVQTNEQYEFIHQALCLHEKSLPETPT